VIPVWDLLIARENSEASGLGLSLCVAAEILVVDVHNARHDPFVF
jgi:hypothetical protein